MIAYIKGQLLSVYAHSLLVQTTGGVGYQVFVPEPLLSSPVDSMLELHVHTHAGREGEISLYGFSQFGEKQLFELLIKTSGVGPKLGMAILSHIPAVPLIKAINQQDVNALTAVPGIGKKTAAKLCLDMRDYLKKYPITDLAAADISTESAAVPVSPRDELLSALVNMGFSENAVVPVLRQVRAQETTFETQFKKALALLSPFR